LHRLNPLAPHIFAISIINHKNHVYFIFAYKLRQARYLSKECIKECKENKPIYPFLFANKVILLLLIAIELPPFY